MLEVTQRVVLPEVITPDLVDKEQLVLVELAVILIYDAFGLMQLPSTVPE